MNLLTMTQRDQLRHNFVNRGDHAPVTKLFNPAGGGTWLVSELADDGDALFGLADLGFGCPEMGYFSLSELSRLRLPYGLSIERDLTFKAHHPLTVYADAARYAGHIVEGIGLLDAAAQRLARERVA